MKNTIYGYCRISTPTQNIERQKRNILAEYPDAKLVVEVYTGTTVQGRPEFDKLVKKVKEGDTIVFDSVSRMSRAADEGVELYMSLYERGVELVFLKEPHINTATYKAALASKVNLTGDKVDVILEGVNEYLMILARDQIKLAFEQSEKEAADIRQRTKEGLLTAKLNGKAVGRQAGSSAHSKKEGPAKEIIRKHCKAFGGTLSDVDVIKLCGVSQATFYKYKRQCLTAKAGGLE